MTTLLECRAPTQTDWKTHLSEAGHEELAQFTSLLKDTTEFFSLFIVQSDFDTETRDALLQELADELAPIPSIEIELTSANYDLPFLLHEANRQNEGAKFFCVNGLEETPGLVLAAGEEPVRPPALAMLNHGREAIRTIDHPVIVWCDPLAYSALREHAPDFFDHYTALFTFIDAAPSEPSVLNQLFSGDSTLNARLKNLSQVLPLPASPETKRFYEEQVARFTHPTIDRVRALLGLASAIFGLPETQASHEETPITALLREALQLSKDLGLRIEVARSQAMLSGALNRERRKDRIDSAERNQEILWLIQQSLAIFEEAQYPVERAASEWALGHFLSEVGVTEADRRQSIPHLQEAGRLWRQQKATGHWASVEMEIGQLYLNLSPTKGNLKRAISYLEKALEGYTEKSWPHNYALVQMFLGEAHSKMARQEQKDKNARGKLMRKSIANFQAAARGFARTKTPGNVAFALASESEIWRELPTGNRREHLRNSAKCLSRSAELLVQAGDDLESAVFFETAGDIYFDLLQLTKNTKELEQSLKCHELARQFFEKSGMPKRAQQNAVIAQSYREGLKNVLSELSQSNK